MTTASAFLRVFLLTLAVLAAVLVLAPQERRPDIGRVLP